MESSQRLVGWGIGMYVNPNFQTKNELRQALKQGPVEVFCRWSNPVPKNGKVQLEGPHCPQPVRWRAIGYVENYELVRIR